MTIHNQFIHQNKQTTCINRNSLSTQIYRKCLLSRAPTTFKLEGEVTSLSESSQGEVGDNREKWEDFWEKLIAIN